MMTRAHVKLEENGKINNSSTTTTTILSSLTNEYLDQ